MADRRYAIPAPDTLDTIASRLAGLFEGFKEKSETIAFEVMDTFDWRMYKKNRLLLKTKNHYTIVDMHTGRPLEAIVVTARKPLRFHWEFPESDFAAMLKDALAMRALMLLGEVRGHFIHRDLLNSDEKIIARLVLETYNLVGKAQMVSQCRVTPVKGYAKAARQISASLEQMGLQPAKQPPVLTLLERNGFSPGAYSSKITIVLRSEMAAAEAVRCIMERLVWVMRANLPGVRDDIDSEFLHDFRVSVRRARSLLSQTKGILGTQTTAKLQGQLKAMGAITGNVRDLDVYLLKKGAYVDLVGEFLKPGVLQLFKALQRKRHYAKNRMIEAMAGVDFKAAMADLDDFIQSDPLSASDAADGSRPIGEVAKAVIYERYLRIIKKGRRINERTPDQRLHNLRIDCKKLRYLLEFFTSLFPKDEMKALIKQLKQLQENLGDFNDLSVQKAFLIQHLGALKPQSSQVVILAAAIGGLITRLGMEHQQVRSRFLGVFNRFGSSENQKRFKTLFA